jgi:hypothetical protein
VSGAARRAAQIELGRQVAHVLRAARGLDAAPSPFTDKQTLAALHEGGVLGLIASHHTRIAEDNSFVQEILEHQTLGVAIQAGTLGEVLPSLQRCGVDPILIKGLATARHHPSLAARPVGDIDLLVSEENLDRAGECLRAAGYSVSASRITYGAGPIVTAYPRDPVPGFYADAGIDLQTHLWPLDPREVEEALRSEERVCIGETDIRVLPTRTEVRFLAVHAAKHAFFRPLWSCDLVAAIESSPGLDWDAVLWGSPRPRTWIQAAVGLAVSLLGMTAPSSVERSTVAPSGWLFPSVLARWGGMRESDRRGDLKRALLARRDPLEALRIGADAWPDALQAMSTLGWPFLRPLGGPSRVALALYRGAHFFTPSLASGD